MFLPAFFLGASFLIPFIVQRSLNEQRRLDSEIEKSENVLRDTLARLERLRTQRRKVRDNNSSLLRRGFIEVDEEDNIRSQEESLLLSEQQAVGEAQNLGAMDIIDWSVFDFSSLPGESLAAVAGHSLDS